MRTSINISEADYTVLKIAAMKMNLTLSQMVEKSLKKLFNATSQKLCGALPLKLVSYQERGRKYRILNVNFSDDLYNLNINFRSFSRLSVSLLVSMALHLYSENMKNDLHNYTQNKWSYKYICEQKKEKWTII